MPATGFAPALLAVMLAAQAAHQHLPATVEPPPAPGYAALAFAPPVAGSYVLPVLGAAADGLVIESSGQRTRLHALYGGKLEAVREWQLGALEQDPGRFRARVEQGRIRDGHGDLRLEHVYFEDAEPIVIDCVEFNERLRGGDAAADVAFLAMELAARSRADLA